MNREEKQAIKILKSFEPIDLVECAIYLQALKKLTNLIEKLQKENKELKEENEYNKNLLDINNNFTIDKKTGNYKWNVIEIQKIKDKIIRNEKIIDISNDEDLIHELYQENKVYEELLKEGE